MQRIKTEILVYLAVQPNLVMIFEVLEDEGAYAVNMHYGSCVQPNLTRAIMLVTEHIYDAECAFEENIKQALRAGYKYLDNGQTVAIAGFNAFLKPPEQPKPEIRIHAQPQTAVYRKLR
jgi:hypothetical protein